MTQKQIESKSLIVSCVVDLIMSAAGFLVFMVTNIQALFLDGFFSLIAFCSCLAALTISKISNKKTKNHPNGLYFLEPLYAIFKSIMTLSLMIFSVIGTAKVAWNYFGHGIGEPLKIEPVIPYAVTMVIMCFGLGFFNRNQNRKTNNTSTILTAESKGNFIDGILSLGVGVSALVLMLIDINGNLGFLHYTGDFFITTALALCSLKEPINILIVSFHELSGGITTNQEIKRTVCKFVEKNLCGIVSLRKCEVYKMGMHIKVCIYTANNIDHKKMQTAKRNLLKDICNIYESAEVVFCE